MSIFTTPGGNDEVVHLFLARGLSPVGQAHAREDEEADIRIEWVPLADAVDRRARRAAAQRHPRDRACWRPPSVLRRAAAPARSRSRGGLTCGSIGRWTRTCGTSRSSAGCPTTPSPPTGATSAATSSGWRRSGVDDIRRGDGRARRRSSRPSGRRRSRRSRHPVSPGCSRRCAGCTASSRARASRPTIRRRGCGRPKQPQRLPKALTIDQVERLLDAARARHRARASATARCSSCCTRPARGCRRSCSSTSTTSRTATCCGCAARGRRSASCRSARTRAPRSTPT